MPDPRATAAIAASKVLTRGIRWSGRGGGTALPGLVATRVDPLLLDKLARRLTAGSIVVAGTNGKTTTSRMLAGILSRSGRKVVHNRSGSNLVRGISAAFAEQMPLFGSGDAEIGVVESDENAFPDVVRRVKPRMVVLLNLFRDQLDRYGELETIAADWSPALQALDRDTLLVVNADDPNLASLARGVDARVVPFGLDAPGYQLPELPHASDAGVCRFCESRLIYDALYLSHLGVYHCPGCGWRRPEPRVVASEIEIDGVDGLRMRVTASGSTGASFELRVGLGGVYNAYNVLAASSTALMLGIKPEVIRDALGSFQAAFGRLERVNVRERQLTLALAKNPVGFNELLRMLTAVPRSAPLVIGINDLDADGRDVSWLWDVDFEALAAADQTSRIFAVGIRGSDLAVRLKYAGVPESRLNAAFAGMPPAQALDGIIAETSPGDEVFLLLTYTTMLELRRALADQGAVAPFWEQ